MENSLHAGHRARVKQEFLAHGFHENTPPHKILELLLFFCLPQGDTNPLAHELINRYGTLTGVLQAPVEELIQFKGLTESNVVLLKLVLPLAQKCLEESSKTDNSFSSIEEIAQFLQIKYFGKTEELLSVLFLNGKGTSLGFCFTDQGDLNSVGISTRKIIEQALKYQATCVVMAHNHPTGTALPSESDLAITRQLADSLRAIGVQLADHIILAGSDYVSLRQSREYNYLFFNK